MFKSSVPLLFRFTAAALAAALFPAALCYGQAKQKTSEAPKIAVWDFSLAGIGVNEGRAVTNRLRSELVNSRKFRVMTRDQIETLLGEQALGETLIDAKEAIRAGKLKGVRFVVAGTLIALRGAFQITAEMIDGETAEIIESITPRTYRGDFLDFLDEEVPALAQRLMGAASGEEIAAAPTPPPPPPPPPMVERPMMQMFPPSRPRPRPPPPRPSSGSGPSLGLSTYIGGGTFAGAGYGTSGVLMGFDYQIPLGDALSLNLLWLLGLESFSGDPGIGSTDSGFASHQVFALQTRVWLGPLFVGGHGGYYTESLSGAFQTYGSSGLGFGGVVGIEFGGISLHGQLDYAFMTSDDGSSDTLLGLTGFLGFRF